MQMELQKAEFWKRMAAGLLDAILLLVVSVGIFALLADWLKMDDYANTVNDVRSRYEQQYGITLDEDVYYELSDEDKVIFDKASEEFIMDDEAFYARQMSINVMLISVAAGVLVAMLLLEFIVPLLFGNGQTLGKKAFAHCVVRVDGVKVTPLQMFVRTILGKYAVELMILIYLTIYLGISASIWVILIFGVIESVLMLVTKGNSAIHDLMAGTVVVDYNSQKIFDSPDDLIAYQKKIAAEQAKRQPY